MNEHTRLGGNQYDRLGSVELEATIGLIEQAAGSTVLTNKLARTLKAEVQGHRVGVTSLRLKTFARDYRKQGSFGCVACGLQARFFAIELHRHNKAATSPHLNLYGVNEANEEVLFTHDHILARGLGGRDHITNTQTMCSPCNAKKAKVEHQAVILIRHRAKGNL